MHIRVQSFYTKEIQICIVMLCIGIAFTLLYFFAETVPPQYGYLFYTLLGFGLIFIFNYGYRYIFYKSRVKKITKNELTPNRKSEIVWLEAKIKEVELFRMVLQVILAIGGLMVLIGFGGFMKQLIASCGLGILFGTAIWFGAELFSELHFKEYRQFLDKESQS